MVGNSRGGVSAHDFKGPLRSVFLVHGRDMRLRKSMVEFPDSLDLRVVTWTEAFVGRSAGTPYKGDDVILTGMSLSDAVVVLMTPSDEGRTRWQFLSPHDPREDQKLVGQPRMNVVLEAGMAMARDRTKTGRVEIGQIRGITAL